MYFQLWVSISLLLRKNNVHKKLWSSTKKYLVAQTVQLILQKEDYLKVLVKNNCGLLASSRNINNSISEWIHINRCFIILNYPKILNKSM